MKYKQSKMVNWFEPSILLQTGLKAVISSLFGNYADRREMQAALDIPAPGSSIREEQADYLKMDDVWIDFISDTGDGFNPTYSVAITAAQDFLTVEADGQKMNLPRAKILILGGDQIYPTPTGEIYDNKFKVPFESALPKVTDDPDYPHMYAIPGNHDWYDGLGSFMKVFCQQRGIGNWKTLQTRSYFALPLPYNYWIWATDIQLNGDIDKPQLNYFRDVTKKMQDGDKVILCTAEPAWIYKQLYEKDKSYEKFCFFTENYITEDKAGIIGKQFELATVLTGDLHHYSHYCFKDDKTNKGIHYIGAGGGGAFLHLTNNLPKKLENLKEKGISLQKAFPEKADSYRLLLGNLVFPFKNYYFSALLGGIYLLFYWLLQSRFALSRGVNYLEHLENISLNSYFKETANMLLLNPVLSLFSIVLIIGFTKFTDIKTGISGIWIWGFLHGLLQCLLIYTLIWLIAKSPYQGIHKTGWYFIFLLELFVVGSFAGGFIMGLYLLLSNLIFGIHIDESSSSLASENYKNFLRMNITKDGLTIYPIGIKKVTTNWKQEENGDKITFQGKLPEYHLIEKPIFIKK